MWDIKKIPEFFNLTQKAAFPGFETRLSLGPDPLFHFECSFEVLREATAGALKNERCYIESFFKARRGGFDSFLISLTDFTQNLADSTVFAQPLTLDSGNVAPIVVTHSGLDAGLDEIENENIYELDGAPKFFQTVAGERHELDAGVDYELSGPGYSSSGISYPGLIVRFAQAFSGVTADFSWFYRVKFEEDKLELNLFSYLLWNCDQIKLVTTRA
jgi:hypothetical protein